MPEVDYKRIADHLTLLGQSSFKEMVRSFLMDDEVSVNFEKMTYMEKISIQMKGEYDHVVYIFKLILFENARKKGYYKYIVDENFDFVDEFFVLD